MTTTTPPGWEPDPKKMGNWQSMFEEDRSSRTRGGPVSTTQGETPRDLSPDSEPADFDLSVYKPWILQRGRSRPAMMLELRRYEPRSGLWTGRALAYPQLEGLEYTGDRMLSLDFGKQQYLLEGTNLDELARHIQQGTVVTVQEHAPSLWPDVKGVPVVAHIRRMDAPPAHRNP